jgi:hypothetical protein
MGISSIVSRVIPTAIGFVTGGPIGAATAAMSTESAKRQERIVKRQIAAENERLQQEEKKLAEIFGSGSLTSVQAPMAGRTTQQAGFGAGFGEFLGDVGRNIVSPFASLAGQLSPFFGRGEVQQPAITTTRRMGAQESQISGTSQAFIGGPGLGQAIGAATRFLKSPGGQVTTGVGIGALTSFIGADGKPIRITRKMKSQYRAVLNLANGDYGLAAEMVGVSQDFFISVLLKRFRNDGPAVTKAALRKTKQTVRRLKSMCDMYDSLRPAATRRRSPMKRASTTLISNK